MAPWASLQHVNEPGSRRAHLRLPAQPAAPREARRFAESLIGEWGMPVPDEDVALVVTELVTNAVLHAKAPIELVIERTSRGIRVSVVDCDPHLPTPPTPRPATAELTFGRGLAVVEAVASRWGATPRGDGKEVWAELV